MDFQIIFKDECNSPLLQRDCFIKAVKLDPFYVPLMAGNISTDGITLHTSLHKYIRQQELPSRANGNANMNRQEQVFLAYDYGI